MKRREFIAGIGTVAWPLAARAQQPSGMKRVAILNGNADTPATRTRVVAFQQGMRNRGWREGTNISFELRWGAADVARIDAYATELVKLSPDVILATTTPPTRSLKRATDTIPIVFAGLSDPIGDGIVANLSKPGRNITGFTSFNAPIAGKWLELLKELSPATTHAGILFNPQTAPHAIFLPVMQAVAPKLGMTVAPMPVTDPGAIESAIGTLARKPHSGFVALPDTFLTLHGPLIFALALRARLPSIGPLRTYADNGALASYGSDFVELFRQASSYVDRILRGEKPGDLPVQEPTKYELIVNLKTARAMALAVPQAVLARADDVVE